MCEVLGLKVWDKLCLRLEIAQEGLLQGNSEDRKTGLEDTQSVRQAMYRHLLTIYEGLFDKPTISIEEATVKLDISIATSSRLLDRLCEEGILSSLDNRKRKKSLYTRSI